MDSILLHRDQILGEIDNPRVGDHVHVLEWEAGQILTETLFYLDTYHPHIDSFTCYPVVIH